jgi:quercetin dioxygenase-like cupin family protein
LERFRFAADVAFTPREELLEGVTVSPLTAPLRTGVPAQAAIFRVAPGGRLRRHPASVGQVLAVLEGSGEVSGGDGVPHAISAGEAVFWEQGEEHETTSAEGMTALIIEAEGLAPYRRPG